MTRPAPRLDPERPRSWPRRAATLLICWVVVWALTGWLQMHPQPVGILAALGALFAVCWWATDRRAAWEPTDWAGDPIGRRLRTSADSRISYLRRLIDDAAVQKADGEPNASAGSVQGILRDITIDRLQHSATTSGMGRVPDDDALIAGADPHLADYLLADPPPLVTHRNLTDIINRIEAL